MFQTRSKKQCLGRALGPRALWPRKLEADFYGEGLGWQPCGRKDDLCPTPGRGVGGGREPVHAGSPLPPGPVGSSKPLLLAYDGGVPAHSARVTSPKLRLNMAASRIMHTPGAPSSLWWGHDPSRETGFAGSNVGRRASTVPTSVRNELVAFENANKTRINGANES